MVMHLLQTFTAEPNTAQTTKDRCPAERLGEHDKMFMTRESRPEAEPKRTVATFSCTEQGTSPTWLQVTRLGQPNPETFSAGA